MNSASVFSVCHIKKSVGVKRWFVPCRLFRFSRDARSFRLLGLVAYLAVQLLVVEAANGTLQLGGLSSLCLTVYELDENANMKKRSDLAERVGNVIRTKVAEARSPQPVRSDLTCIKPNQMGFDRQLMLDLSVKKQVVKIDGQNWHLIIVGGVSAEGLFQDRALQPVIILERNDAADDSIVEALIEFVDRTIVASLRR